MININETHDQNLKSWVESANNPNTDFPIQNLPFCYFTQNQGSKNLGVVIGDYILNLDALREEVFEDNSWVNDGDRLAQIDVDKIPSLRKELTTLLSDNYPEELRDELLSLIHI